MEAGVGNLLRELRVSRRCSIRSVAAQAGISKSALSDWESGKNLPRLPELEATLKALGASAIQRRRCLALLDAPRAIRLLRHERAAETHATLAGTAPNGGDLLRAMRLRRKRTLEELAGQIGVRPSTVSRWERGDSWPTTEHLHALCFSLQAHSEELLALTDGKFNSTPHTSQDSTSNWHEELKELVFFSHTSQQEALEDLRFLTMITRLWPEAGRRKEAVGWLIPVYARYGQFLAARGRYREAQDYIERVFDSVRETPTSDAYWLCAGNVAAEIAVYSGARLQPRKGILALRNWLDYLAGVPEAQEVERAWAMSDMAEYIALDGSMDAAVEISRQACRTTEEYDASGYDTMHRQRDLAHRLLQAGRAKEGLQTLQAGQKRGLPEVVLQKEVMEAELYLALGERSAAQACLQKAYSVFENHSLTQHRPRVEALSLKLNANP